MGNCEARSCTLCHGKSGKVTLIGSKKVPPCSVILTEFGHIRQTRGFNKWGGIPSPAQPQTNFHHMHMRVNFRPHFSHLPGIDSISWDPDCLRATCEDAISLHPTPRNSLTAISLFVRLGLRLEFLLSRSPTIRTEFWIITL